MRLIVGCRLILADGTDLLVYPTDRAAYARLCRLLSVGKARGGKGRSGMSMKDEDAITGVFSASTHTPVLFFATNGKAYWLVYPPARRNRPAIRAFRKFILTEAAADA